MSRIPFVAGIPALVLASASLAHATPVTPIGLSAMPTNLPAECRAVAEIPRSATIAGPAIAAHVSAANCMAERALSAIRAKPDAPTLSEMTSAVGTSVAMLDSVSALGDPYWTVVAEDAKRDLYRGMIVRARNATPSDVASRDKLEPMLSGWTANAERSEVIIAETTRTSPQLVNRDPVIAYVISRNEQERAGTRTARR